MTADRLPSRHFTLEQWRTMPIYAPRFDGDLAPTGFSRMSNVVVYRSPYEAGDVNFSINFAVRPVVRVPMRKA